MDLLNFLSSPHGKGKVLGNKREVSVRLIALLQSTEASGIEKTVSVRLAVFQISTGNALKRKQTQGLYTRRPFETNI
jgi:hypothetical protein